MDDEMKKAEQATRLAMIQDKAQEFQFQANELQKREYQGRVQGINIVMKGNFEVINVHIDQSFYETASKGQIEIAITKCINNLHVAVQNDMNALSDEFQNYIARVQKESQQQNGTD